MAVDAHHHFWDPTRRAYPWMGDELAAIRRPFGPEDLRPFLAAGGIDKTILVQTVSSVEETREFLATAAVTDFIAGVVGWVDLTDRSVGATIRELRASPGGHRLVGVRHQVHDEADPEWLLRGDVQRGIAAVGDAGLVYDLLLRTRELPAALKTVKRHRRMQFVIDHAAKPRIASGPADQQWEKAMAPFADQANVACKLSGLVTEADWKSWTPEQLEPYVRRVLEWFGPERCVFGSDWPVCLLAASYEQVVNSIKAIVGDDDEVFGATAMRVYGLVLFMRWQDLKPSDEVQAADWIAGRLHPFGSVTVGSVVPTGFAAYARVESRTGLAPVLARHTATSQRCWFCLWEGYGYLGGGRSFFWLRAAPARGELRLEMPNRRPLLPKTRVRLPNRDYLFFTGDVTEGEGWEDGPNLGWPDDKAWCLASEIDLDYTLIGGSEELVDDLIREAGATRVTVDSPL